MDAIDVAAKTEAQFQQVALANQRARAMQNTGLPGRSHCLECGLAIPRARQENVRGCQYCTRCQAAREER